MLRHWFLKLLVNKMYIQHIYVLLYIQNFPKVNNIVQGCKYLFNSIYLYIFILVYLLANSLVL